MINENKVTIVYYDLNGEIANESVWVEKIGDYFKLLNIPFFAPNLAFHDVISVEDDEGTLYFDDIIEQSGHSTVQIIIFIVSEIPRILNQIEKHGCTWEGMHGQKYIAMDIPPNIDYKLIKSFLKVEFNNKILDYKEACLAH
jgi:Domain of unknown function (DUF4265)